jgi:NAD(P)H-hydrate epimerase
MMENAGHGVADFVVRKFKTLKNKRIVAMCGTGNNGGDGFVASRHLAGYGAKVVVILLGSPSDLRSEEARLNWSIIEKMDSIELIFGKELTSEIKSRITNANIILDGIFGTGIKDEIVLAVDIPSGFDPNTGQIHKKCIMADATITFHRLKVGLADKKKNKKKYTGPVYVEWIGIPPEAEKGIV